MPICIVYLVFYRFPVKKKLWEFFWKQSLSIEMFTFSLNFYCIIFCTQFEILKGSTMSRFKILFSLTWSITTHVEVFRSKIFENCYCKVLKSYNCSIYLFRSLASVSVYNIAFDFSKKISGNLIDLTLTICAVEKFMYPRKV